MNKTANVSNIKLTEKCTKTVKIQVIHNIKKMHVIRVKKCFNRVHSFTLAGKHQIHSVRELPERLCLHKEPEMLNKGTYCLNCVTKNLEIIAFLH